MLMSFICAIVFITPSFLNCFPLALCPVISSSVLVPRHFARPFVLRYSVTGRSSTGQVNQVVVEKAQKGKKNLC